MLDMSPRTLDLKDRSLQGSRGPAKRKAFKYAQAAVVATVDELDNTKYAKANNSSPATTTVSEVKTAFRVKRTND